MKQFFQTFLACLLALAAAGVIFFLIAGFIFFGLSTLVASRTPSVDNHSVLYVTLSTPIIEDPTTVSFTLADAAALSKMQFSRPLVLADVLKALEKAETDDRIAGIYLRIDPNVPQGLVTMAEIRQALLHFKASGKFVVSYGDRYTQRSYYLSSVAGRVLLNPEGEVSWFGMSSGVMFYKGLLDKLGVQAEAIRVGDYKSAVEPFVTDRMSPQNRQQTEVMVRALWGNFVHQVALARGVDSTTLQDYATTLKLNDAPTALQCKMVDSLCYGEDADSLLVAWSGIKDATPRLVSLADYVSLANTEGTSSSKNKIGVVYAEGQIVDGPSMQGMVGSRTLGQRLADMEADSAVKAVVLRINSPGGSALASEVIWNAAERLRRHKPLIVSMGNVAASGGYYIACGADVILASPETLTGSIGVFGLVFNGAQGLKEKLGITVDVVKSNPSADMESALFGAVGVRSLSDTERAFMQQSVERVYRTFLKRVSAGRNLTVAEVDSVAGGRVWSGEDALRVGLIDGMGGLSDAVLLAADRAGVGSDFRVVTPQAEESMWMQLADMFDSEGVSSRAFEGEMGSVYEAYQRLRTTLSSKGVQALCTQWIDLP